MDSWNDDIGLGEEQGSSSKRQQNGLQGNAGRTGGGWHWGMTLVCLFTVAALSFLMAWLTKNMLNRPFWMIGAIFTVPTFGMFAAAMLMEQKTSAMTPSTSRKAQYLVALAAILSTFAVGCVFDLIYQQGTMEQIIKNWAENHPPEKVYSDIILVVDKSSSLADDGKDAANQRAIRKWLNSMDDYARVGMIVFSHDVHREVPIDTLSNNRQKIESAMDYPTGGITDFDVSLYHAFRMVDVAEGGEIPEKPIQIIAITDAEAVLPQKLMDEYSRMAKEKNVIFSIVHLGQDVPASNPLVKIAAITGGTGTSVGVSELSRYFESVQIVEPPDWDAYYRDLRNNGEVDFDMIRVSDPEANLLCGLMLGLEGLAIGLCLMLMLSVTGQKRIQPVISVLMAAAAFVLLKILGPGIGPLGGDSRLNMPQWVLEGIAFSLLGVVFMMKNHPSGTIAAPSGKGRKSSSSDSFDDFGGSNTDTSTGNSAETDSDW